MRINAEYTYRVGKFLEKLESNFKIFPIKNKGFSVVFEDGKLYVLFYDIEKSFPMFKIFCFMHKLPLSYLKISDSTLDDRVLRKVGFRKSLDKYWYYDRR